MSLVGIIPAKSQSQGLLGKNLTMVGGKPLVQWTIEACLNSCTSTYVTTDDAEIAKIADDLGAYVIERPGHLCAPDVHAVHTVLHAIDHLDFPKSMTIGMFQPTSPFRDAEDIIAAEKLLEDPFSSVIGVVRGCPLNSLRELKTNGALLRYSQLPMPGYEVQRQDVPLAYFVNGSIYISKVEQLVKNKSFHKGIAAAYVMSKMKSIDINDTDDLVMAKALLS